MFASKIKRLILTVLGFCLLQSCVLVDEKSHADREAVWVSTESGFAVGYHSKSSDEPVLEWLDIPYAQAPVREYRWRAPRKISRPGTIIPQREMTACVQESSSYGGVEGTGIVGTEDCLYLDIRAPLKTDDGDIPVMFWIHGGGNVIGSKNWYDFSRLVATENVIVVTINYRLGALGWFTHPAIQGAQEGLDASSNYGTLDIIQALTWVRDNISEFGGAKDNITIFGESAGGHNVLALLASPLAKNLFHKAIVQSGFSTSTSLERAYDHGDTDSLIRRGSWRMVNEYLSSHTNETRGQDSMPLDDLNKLLKGLDTKDLFELYANHDEDDSLPLTTADGIVIPLEGLHEALADKKYAKNVPVIAGATRDELTLWLGLHRYFVEESYPFTRLFPAALRIRDPDLYRLWVEVRSHAWKIRGVDQVLSNLELAGNDALFSYRFDWDDQEQTFFADFPELIGAAHATEIAFLTGVYKYGPIGKYIYPVGELRDEMEKTMMSTWGSFAHFSDPSISLPIGWPKFTDQQKNYLVLDKAEDMRILTEEHSIDSLLDLLIANPTASDLERCTIVWESLVNVGDPDFERFGQWNNGFCRGFDIPEEQKRVSRELRKLYGSTTLM